MSDNTKNKPYRLKTLYTAHLIYERNLNKEIRVLIAINRLADAADDGCLTDIAYMLKLQKCLQ